MNNFSILETQQTHQNVERTLNAFYNEIKNLDIKSSDWAIWNDTYNFINDSNENYIKSNINATTFTSLNINLMLFINSKGKIIFGKAFDLKSNEEIKLPAGLKEHISPKSLLLPHYNVESGLAGIIVLPEGPLMISSRPILTTEKKGPIRGTLIFGKFLDIKEIKKLIQITHFPIKIYNLYDKNLPDNKKKIHLLLSEKPPIIIEAVDENKMAGYSTIKDIYGQNKLILKIDMPREVYKQGKNTLYYTLFLLLMIGLLVSGAISYLLDKVVISRLITLSSDVINIGKSGDLSSRIVMTGNDELSNLTGEINRMLEVLQKAQNELKESEKSLKISEDNLRRRNWELSTLYTIYKDIAEIMKLENIVNHAIDEIQGLLGIEAIGVYLLEPDRETMKLSAYRGLSDEFVKGIKHFKIGESICEKAIAEKNVVVFDVADYPTGKLIPFIISEGFKTLVSIPLISANEVIGVINLGSKFALVEAFSREEIDLLTALGYQFGIAIRNAQLYEKVQHELAERIRVEQALRQSESKYRALFEESKDVVFFSMPDGQLVDINPAGVELFGYSSEEEFLESEKNQDHYFNSEERKRIKQFIGKQDFIKDFELSLKKKDGQKVTVLMTASVIKNNGNIIGYRGIMRDITDWKKLEQQLIQAQKMQSIYTLAGGIAHDFNNILNIILGYTSLLELGEVDSENFSKSTEAINKAVQRGASLTQKILTFARKNDVVFEPVNINNTIVDLAKMLTETFPRTLTISVRVGENVPLIMADHNQLDQALLNLCVNARDAILEKSVIEQKRKEGTISINTKVITGKELRKKFSGALGQEYVCIGISDTGTGMDETTKNRIFDPFFTTKEVGKGTGLGLTVVYGIVQAHRGFIDVDSERGYGSKFNIYLPITECNIESVEMEKDKKVESLFGNETILIVEDEESLIKLVKIVLEGKGYNVLMAKDGIEAIEKYKQYKDRIALVLTDMGLPKLDGIALFKILKEINPQLRVILASGYLEPTIKSELFKAGIKDFIQKPYIPQDIVRRIREVIDLEKGNSMQDYCVKNAKVVGG